MPPRAFKTENEFYKKMLDYVKYCKQEERMPNVAGFAVYADINQDTFYAQKNYYSETFKKVNDMLEDEALNNKYVNDTMRIFYMKNKCKYKDKQEIENSVNLNNPFDNMSLEEIRERLDQLKNE